MEKTKKYIPALRFKWLTPLYDPFLRWGMREETFKQQLIKQANIQPGQNILDLGCGTGTLTIMIKQVHPESHVTGLDGDLEVLEIARSKAAKAGVDIALDHSMAYHLPYPGDTFDRVVSSLMLHHLDTEDKQRTMAEVYRVLRPGGEFHIVDFGKQRGLYGKLLSPFISRLEQASDNLRGLLPRMLKDAGFTQVEELVRYTTIVGSIASVIARKPR